MVNTTDGRILLMLPYHEKSFVLNQLTSYLDLVYLTVLAIENQLLTLDNWIITGSHFVTVIAYWQQGSNITGLTYLVVLIDRAGMCEEILENQHQM